MADNYSDNQLDLISSGETTYAFDESFGDYIQVIVSNQDGDVVTLNDGSLAIFRSNKALDGGFNLQYNDEGTPGQFVVESEAEPLEPGGDPTLVFEPITPQVKIYRDTDDNIFVKPNEILSTFNIPSGNYQLRFDFLRNYKD